MMMMMRLDADKRNDLQMEILVWQRTLKTSQ